RYDTVLVNKDPTLDGFRGMYAARIRLLFSFWYSGTLYPCALVEWFLPLGDEPDKDTGMWIVEPQLDEDSRRPSEVIHLDSVARAVHLIPVFGGDFIPVDLRAYDSLDAFRAYYVNMIVGIARRKCCTVLQSDAYTHTKSRCRSGGMHKLLCGS
ncbi:hypothetical protein POSPLADRAFT_1160487, partial [Postia placenta MAD-698-R-SB12]